MTQTASTFAVAPMIDWTDRKCYKSKKAALGGSRLKVMSYLSSYRSIRKAA